MSNATTARAARDPRSAVVDTLIAALFESVGPPSIPDTVAARMIARTALGEAFDAGARVGCPGCQPETRLALVRTFLEGLADVARGDQAHLATVSLESVTSVLRVLSR